MTFVHDLAKTAAFALTAALTLAACRGEDPLTSASAGTDTTTTSGGDTSSTTGTDTPTTSSTSTTNDSSTTAVDPTTGTPTTTNMSAGFITTDTTQGTTGPGNPQPNGGMCQTDDDCESMNCYTSPLFPDGGICSECNEDADCVRAGTGISCSLGPSGATCAAGGYGNQCMSQDACQDGLICGPAVDLPIPGIIPDTCGECSESADCDMGMICTPELDIQAFSGAKKCVEPGSVENGALCPLGEDDADAACASGKCGEVDVMGFLTLGVCGECKTDADCMNGTCTPGSLGQGGAMGSVCQ
ncbi:hypothetical protein SAMN02745121_00690 [Nannocystis exedens]|uniref:Tryptophan synthase alpha chain n=1 Tax=Nannocystis exedens TaxID=54 RepID=A0A1I1TKE0_9BACT|nr:hypothetical protein [Nannocystis exedens]PCC66580.1 hypothetical protein NAEX_09169 [Nannocystis exedens]SFD57638.1 hypothetical protein SAMN02745121_00690 [Nannocystis exedens]